jgi:hypothetical protein
MSLLVILQLLLQLFDLVLILSVLLLESGAILVRLLHLALEFTRKLDVVINVLPVLGN